MSSRPLAWTQGGGLMVIMALLMMLGGCVHTREEPGLFGRAEMPTREPSEPLRRGSTDNPKLPVVGETLWTSTEGLALTVRIAVHTVRRIPGATVLDWSVTPLSGAGLNNGEPVPTSFNLGLTRFGEDTVNIFLFDGRRGQIHRPLTRIGPGRPACLCIPSRLAQVGLRVGETSLLQVAYPPLPSDLRSVDVAMATVPIFSSVPVTPVGMIPLVNNPISLARSAAEVIPVAGIGPFRYRTQGQRFSIGVDAVWSSSTFTSIAWTITSLEDGPGLKDAAGPPFADDPSPSPAYNLIAASGPRLQLAGEAPLRSRLISTKVDGRGALECLCTDLRAWPSALQEQHQLLNVVTNLPPIPRRTSLVDLVFPGVGTMRDVPVATAPDATFRSAGPAPHQPEQWTFREASPQSGWPALNWPTPVPDSRELGDFRATVDEIAR
jgi:hypothetical protein